VTVPSLCYRGIVSFLNEACRRFADGPKRSHLFSGGPRTLVMGTLPWIFVPACFCCRMTSAG
jgi:hypothetical protein